MTRALRPIAVLSLALLVLVGQLQALGHSVQERHSVCDEHGEIVHDADRPQHQAAGPLAVLSAGQAEGHEHGCALLSGLCPASPSPAPPAASTLLAVRPLSVPPRALPAPPPARAPLALAPKTSPPASAPIA